MPANIRQYFSAPDDALMTVALGGEKVAAIMRLSILGLLWASSILLALLLDEVPFELIVGISAGGIAVASALIVLYLSYHPKRNTLRHFLICAFDISLITLTLWFFAFSNKPEVTINSMVIWQLYVIFIAASCIYFDARICITTGLLAFTQYLILLVWVTSNWDMHAHAIANIADSSLFAGISWYKQVARLALLLVITLIAIGIVHRSRKLLTLSGTDSLTGLENRRVLEIRLEQEISRVSRKASKFCVVFLDIDHFKKFNDQFGHAVGDQALVIFAKLLRKHLRKEDVISRWGGEEFVIVLPNSNTQEASTLLERIKSKMADLQLPQITQQEPITFSAGISEFPTDGTKTDDLINAADKCLKYAKEHGRNQIITT